MVIEFMKGRGSYDFVSPLVNISGTAILAGVVAKVSSVALNSLGYTGVFASGLSITGNVVAIIMGGIGVAALAALVYGAVNFRLNF